MTHRAKRPAPHRVGASWAYRFVAALGLALAGNGSTAPATSHLVRYKPPFPVAEITVSLSGQTLIWNYFGRAQILNSASQWGKAFNLPTAGIVKIRPDREGFLLLGTDRTGRTATLLLDENGAESVRWATDRAADIVTAAPARYALTEAGAWLPLHADATVGNAQSGPGPTWSAASWRFPTRTPTDYFQYQEAQIICRNPNPLAALAKESREPAQCERVGASAWRFEQLRTRLVDSPCGQWLAFREGPHLENLGLLSLESGTVVARRSLDKASPRVTCAGDRHLLIGHDRLELLELPSLRLAWASIPVKNAPVDKLAATRDWILYGLKGHSELLMAKRPN